MDRRQFLKSLFSLGVAATAKVLPKLNEKAPETKPDADRDREAPSHEEADANFRVVGDEDHILFVDGPLTSASPSPECLGRMMDEDYAFLQGPAYPGAQYWLHRTEDDLGGFLMPEWMTERIRDGLAGKELPKLCDVLYCGHSATGMLEYYGDDEQPVRDYFCDEHQHLFGREIRHYISAPIEILEDYPECGSLIAEIGDLVEIGYKHSFEHWLENGEA